MGLFNFWKSKNQDNKSTKIKLITDNNNWYSAWGGEIYDSDIVRSATRPLVKAIGKSTAKHIRDNEQGLKVNPDAYIKFLLDDPNPYCTGQMFREKMAIQLALNNNAFALIYKNQDGLPIQLYPIHAVGAEAIRKDNGELDIRFNLKNGKSMTVNYRDLIHLRDDYADHDIFGKSKAESVIQLLEVINASDKSIIEAVKNSAVIKWLLEFASSLKKKDRDMQIKEFVDSYLDIENNHGVAYSDPSYKLTKIDDKQQYVPDSSHQNAYVTRIYNIFNTNKKIVEASYNEDEWLAFYESSAEPLLKQMSEEFTRKLFSRRERSHGNKIVFDSTSLTYASMKTKLELVKFVDRGMMSANEVRKILSMPPVESGDEFVRRLDTVPIEGGEDNKKQPE